MTNTQKWLDKNYPKEGGCLIEGYNFNKRREKITKLNISHKGLGGSLKIESFPNLEELDCRDNQLTKLDLSECTSLKKLECRSNRIKNINLKGCSELESVNLDHNELETIDLSSCSNLISLHAGSNKFSNTHFLKGLLNKNKLKELVLFNNINLGGDLKFLTVFTGLKVLNIKDCSLSGSLKPLRNSKSLEEIDISNTDIEEGLEYLPKGCEKVLCGCDYQSGKKVAKISKELGKFLDSDLVINDKHPNLYHNLVKWREERCDSISSTIPLERLYVIRSNIKNFVDKWGKKGEKDKTVELVKLESPQELKKKILTNMWTIRIAQLIGRGSGIVGAVLIFQDLQAIGGGILGIYPIVELVVSKLEENLRDKEKKWEEFLVDVKKLLDNYHELLGILKTIKFEEAGRINKVLNRLRGKIKDGKIDRKSITGVFLKNYDKDENGTIDILELIENKDKFSKDLQKEEQDKGGSQLGDILLAVKELEEKIIKYRQGTLYEENEENVQEREEVRIAVVEEQQEEIQNQIAQHQLYE